MVQTTQLRAAKKFGPGYFIQEQMDFVIGFRRILLMLWGYLKNI